LLTYSAGLIFRKYSVTGELPLAASMYCPGLGDALEDPIPCSLEPRQSVQLDEDQRVYRHGRTSHAHNEVGFILARKHVSNETALAMTDYSDSRKSRNVPQKCKSCSRILRKISDICRIEIAG
jgi:hypothetical protein